MKALITYRILPSFTPCGTSIGADGAGHYAYIISGESKQVYEKLKELVEALEKWNRVTDIDYLIHEDDIQETIKEINV